MIWREAYRSLVSYDEAVPVLERATLSGAEFNEPPIYVLLIARGFEALVQQNVWWKLHAEDFSNFKHVYRVFANLSRQEMGEVDSMVAPSHRDQTLLVTGDAGDFFDATQPNQCVAAIVKEAKLLIAVRGLPTEDCWEEFSRILRSELDRSGSGKYL